MEKSSGTKEELLEEISDLKSKIRKLEKSQSQHKPSDMALHASEQKFRQLAEDMPALICTFLPDSTLTYVNAAYCKLFSKRPDELVGQKFVDFLPDDATREKVKHQYMSLTPENSVKTYEHKVIVADGTGKAHWHRWTDHAFFKDNGEISHFQSIGQDITESKKAADALKESELKYRSYIENAPNGVFIADENGRYLQVNPAACRITGYSDKELLSMSILDLVPPESRETAGNHFRQVVETGYAQGEFPFLHKQYPGRYWSVEAIRLSATHFMGFVQDITERKQAEAQSKATLEALRQSEASLAEAQCIARIGSWDWDMISNTVKWSKEMYRIFGIRPDEYDGNPESLLKVIHPDDVERLTSIVKSNSLTGNPISLEFRLIHKSGSIHHIFAACRVEFNDEGRPIRNIGTAQDFTERKRAESQREAALDALQESEFFLKTLLNSIPIPVFYKDRNGRYLGFNKAFETFFGDTKEKLIGKTVFDINPPDLAAIYQARDNELFESGGEQQYASQVKNALGTMRAVIFNKAVFTNSHGAISGQIGAIVDITERKQAEVALHKSDLLYRLLVENINDIIWTFDLSSMTYTFVSPSAQRLLGYDADETMGVNLDFIFTPETKKHVMKTFGKLLADKVEGNRVVMEAEHRHKDGSLIMMEISTSPLKNDLGNIVGLLGVSRDISARKQAEEVLRESEERYKAITEYSHNAICIVDEQAKISWVNSVMVAMSGYSQEQLYAVESFADFLAPESIEFVVSNFYKVLEGQPYEHHYSFYVIRADGEKRLFEKHMMDFRDKSGKLKLIISMMDITDRKQAETAMRVSEENFRRSLDESPLGVRVVTVEGDTLYANQAILDIYGYDSIEELKTTTVEKRYTPESYAEYRIRWEKRKRGVDVPPEYAIDIIRKDGDVRHLQVYRKEILWNGERQDQAIYQNITDRKQAEQEKLSLIERIERERDYTSNIIQSMMDMLIVLEPDGTIKSISQVTENILQYSSKELIGKNIGTIVEAAAAAAAAAGEASLIISLAKQELIGQVEKIYLAKDGSKIPVLFSGSVMRDISGKVEGIVCVARDITERKQAEEALRASEGKYQNLFDNAQVALFRTRISDSKLIEINKKYADMAGYSNIEDCVAEFIPANAYAYPAGRNILVGLLQENGVVTDYETEIVRRDGTHIWIVLSATIFPEQGFLEGSIVDITERKHTEEKLRELTERLRLATVSAKAGVWDWNLQTNEMIWDDRMLELYGLTREKFPGGIETWMQALHPDDSVKAIEEYEAALRGEKDFEPEFRIRRPDGKIVYIKAHGFVLRDEEGKAFQMIGLNTDISDRKRAEEVLRESEERYGTIFDQSPIAIEFYDSDGCLINVNSACINLFGVVNRNEISGFKLFEDPNISGDVKTKLLAKEAVRFEAEFNFEEVKRLHLYQTTCSGIKILDWSISPLINGIGYIEQIQDITDRRRAEEEKQALEERLSRAEKMEALGLLAGGVAHDLNNVLGIVVGYAEMLLSEVDEESPLREDVVTIIEGGQRAAAIVEDMLTIARRGVSGRKVLNLNKLVGDFKKSPDWEKLLSYHPNVQISTDLEPDLLNISGSSIHLVKTLYNLVSNASESMPKGGTITIKTTNQYIDKPISGYDTIREGDYVVFSVSDEGEGISETDIKRIFEPFYTKKIMGRSGTGLGLSVVWGTVKDHQGYIDVRSEEGKGTTFTLYFQVTREDITVDDIGVSLSEYLGNGESILVVDDVKKQRDLAARMLKSLNYNVSSAASGEDTVEYLKEHKVDLLVLDMIMDPGMDGLDTYKSVLKINPKQKAIIVSGFSESDRVNAAHDLGAGAYVKKPYVIEKLGMAVKKELGEKR